MTSLPDQTTTRGKGRRVESFFALLRRFSRLWGFGLFLVFTVYLFREVVAPFIFAFALSYLLSPIIRRMAPKIGRVLSVLVVYLGVFAVIGGFVGVLLPALIHDFTRLRDSAPQMITYVDENVVPEVSAWIEDSFGPLDDGEDAEELPRGELDGVRDAFAEPFGPDVAPSRLRTPPAELIATPRADGSWQISLEGVRLNIEETGHGSWTIEAPSGDEGSLGDTMRKLVATKGSEYTGRIAEGLRALISGVTSFLTRLVITFMLAAFILIDPTRISGFVRSLIPFAYRDGFDELVDEIDTGLAGVIRGQLLICLVNAILTWIGLMVVGVKYAFLLALVAGVFSLIPIFGTIISSIPIMIVAMISGEQGPAFGPPLLMLAWISGIHLLEANVLNPKIIGDSAHMHPVIVVFALLAGENLYGLTGALLAVPAASVVQTLYLYALRRSEVFQRGSSPESSAVAAFQGDEGDEQG